MITKFFNTSKPIHFVIMAVFTLLVFLFSRLSMFTEGITPILFLKEASKYIVVLSSIFVFDFLVSKNKLTKKNGYGILIYSLLLAMLPKTMQVNNVLLANFFILLALRRVISLRSNLNIKKKLFDAAFWIGIASLFYFWAILFFVLIIAAMVFYSINHFKNWIIPFIGIAVVAIITISYSVVADNSFGSLSNYINTTSFSFLNYNPKDLVITISILVILGIWALFNYIINLKKKQKTYRSSYILIIVAFLLGASIIFITPDKNGREFLFIFSSMAIIMSNYLETIKKQWLAELFVWILILTPISLLML